ncbi:Gfo/Idh/MocA family oxidoreductase [Paenibacillus doosanensis]|uniref:Gfo/Idh/MocA family protein n=1 Tax=Paenibacillus doosanensis TaxID=1229154 RepID=UPI00218088DA|nr:Gfo/Idh/MocA family oxidoreductase [Paenibacillus doosanensis]MCS7463845.1 Gfo/Idh/MocA family oxidoreductase [Paenibacillus doosanensis]
MKKTLYRVAISGLGNRGWSHLAGFAAHADRFQVSAVCSSSADKLRIVKSRFEDCLTYSDTEKMLAEVRPDVFCFATPPSVRLSYVRLAARYGVKAIAMEKPIAGSLQEAREISRICSEHGIQVVVCHQHKYLPSFVRLKQFVQSGDIGEIVRIHGKTRGWLYNSGTHFVDYLLWINGGVKADWVVGHVHGKGKLEDSHPSPEYALGELHFGNGVTGIIECGYLSPPYLSEDRFWTDNRLTVHGTHGYAWAETDGRWGAFTRHSQGQVLEGQEAAWSPEVKDAIQADYTKDLADWMDDRSKLHPCNFDISEHGYEILYAICASSLDHARIDLPLQSRLHGDIIGRMEQELPDVSTEH